MLVNSNCSHFFLACAKIIKVKWRILVSINMSTFVCKDYEYIDSGQGKKLERFGQVYLVRSCPFAIWNINKAELKWISKENIIHENLSGQVGRWSGSHIVPTDWYFSFGSFKLCLFLSEQGQIGVFPEQMTNWHWIVEVLNDVCKDVNTHFNCFNKKNIRILNGFSHTGGSTMAALSVDGVEVVHLDSSETSVQIARNNLHISNYDQKSVRWIVDDCMTYINREIKRGSRYDALVFDPPAFGRGLKKHHIWKLDRDLPVLAAKLSLLLSDTPVFVLLSCHDAAWPPARLELMVRVILGDQLELGRLESGLLEVHTTASSSRTCRSLQLGNYARWRRSSTTGAMRGAELMGEEAVG